MDHHDAGLPGPISVFLADDNLIVREGVRALINSPGDLCVVGVAADFDELVSGAEATQPQVIVTDIRMPPTFRREGIDAAREVRKRHPGTGVVVLSQYEDPEYAVSLLAEGSAGYGYLLKDRVAEGSQLADAIRVVATGGTALDPAVVEALIAPVVPDGGLLPAEEELLGMVAEGPPGGDRRGGRRGLRQAGPWRLRGQRRRVAAAPHAAPGHRRPGGARGDAVPAAAQRPGREAQAGAA
jgi:DNA-binding NarL/FixJ family response regulator